MKYKPQMTHIQRDYRELVNFIGIAAILVVLLLSPLLNRPAAALKVDISYEENDAFFMALSPADTDPDWYLYPQFLATRMEKYPELHTFEYEDREIYHSSYRVVLWLPVLLTNRERVSVGPFLTSSGYLVGDEGRILGYGGYVSFDNFYNSYDDGDLAPGQTVRTPEYFDFAPEQFEKAAYASLSVTAFVENGTEIKEAEGPAAIIAITDDMKSSIRADGEKLMEAFDPPGPAYLSCAEYAEWELDAIITDAYTWAADEIYKSEKFGRNNVDWQRDDYGYNWGAGERRTDGDSIVTTGTAIIDNNKYKYEMAISIDSWRVTRLVVGGVVVCRGEACRGGRRGRGNNAPAKGGRRRASVGKQCS